ncbi:MFS transporter, partial [Streptosporangium algeriense]
GAALVAPAKQAFLDGMHVTSLVSAAIALLGALVVLRWLPGKNAAAPAVEQHDLDKEPVGV